MTPPDRAAWPAGSSPAAGPDDGEPQAAQLFAGPGEAAAHCRALDWAATPLGPVGQWPAALRWAVRLCLDSGLGMCVYAGPEYVLVYNDAFVQALGVDKHPWALGRPAREVWLEIWEQIAPEFAQVLAGGSPIHYADQRFVIERDGQTQETFWTYAFSPVRAEDGSVVGIHNVATETTARMRAEVALRDSEERFRLAVHSSSLGSFDLDAQTLQLHWSENAYRMFGYDDASVMAMADPASRVHPEDRARVDAAIAAAWDPVGSGQYRTRYRVVWPDGSLHWIEAIGTVRFEGSGPERRPVRLAGVLWDITEHQHLVDALRYADRAKDEFLAMLAHELRNPLAPLTNAHALLERAEPLSERGRRALALAQRQTRQLRRLVDDLLEVSRITRGRIELRCEPMSVGAAVHAAVESIAAMVEQRSQQIEVELPAKPVRIVADPARVAQVLENLLTNASKYTPPGGAIRVEVDEGDNQVAVCVIDNGIGIEPDKLGHVFELFTQVDAALDRSQGGLGIGLALVKRLVELHGGSVQAISAGPGQGATFTVRLPRIPLESSASEPVAT